MNSFFFFLLLRFVNEIVYSPRARLVHSRRDLTGCYRGSMFRVLVRVDFVVLFATVDEPASPRYSVRVARVSRTRYTYYFSPDRISIGRFSRRIEPGGNASFVEHVAIFLVDSVTFLFRIVSTVC